MGGADHRAVKGNYTLHMRALLRSTLCTLATEPKGKAGSNMIPGSVEGVYGGVARAGEPPGGADWDAMARKLFEE